ncbi:hypothetical protein M413DRAFT_32859 [Hebeloma cylindrosporum]|uniref:Uncharacterized protein n=1 Tax=Hebeloma cylindrosporum TaxID=76867 RepID=A0A0C2Y1K4_HEBCY|nr:hypothetical protein M413DRAFT_32859 [Hebeloma cylindrosporum h7]
MSSRNNSNSKPSLIPYVSSEDEDDQDDQLSDDGSSHENPPAASTALSSISSTINNWRASNNSKSKSEVTQAKKTRNLLNVLASLPTLPGSSQISSSATFSLAQKETNQGLKRSKAKKVIKSEGASSSKSSTKSKSKSKPAPAKGKAKAAVDCSGENFQVASIIFLTCGILDERNEDDADEEPDFEAPATAALADRKSPSDLAVQIMEMQGVAITDEKEGITFNASWTFEQVQQKLQKLFPILFLWLNHDVESSFAGKHQFSVFCQPWERTWIVTPEEEELVGSSVSYTLQLEGKFHPHFLASTSNLSAKAQGKKRKISPELVSDDNDSSSESSEVEDEDCQPVKKRRLTRSVSKVYGKGKEKIAEIFPILSDDSDIEEINNNYHPLEHSHSSTSTVSLIQDASTTSSLSLVPITPGLGTTASALGTTAFSASATVMAMTHSAPEVSPTIPTPPLIASPLLPKKAAFTSFDESLANPYGLGRKYAF